MNYLLHEYPTLDYISKRKYFVRLNHPSRIKPEDRLFFGDGIAETADTKIGELLDRYNEIKTKYKNNKRYFINLAKKDNWDDSTLYFWMYLEGIYFEELIVIKKWLYYWKSIYDKSLNPRLPDTPKNGLTEDDIQTARDYPIESLYQGDLRQLSGKLIGLCPFHEEDTPSFTIFPDNHYYCFGCQVHGDSIDFFQKQTGMDFINAVKELK